MTAQADQAAAVSPVLPPGKFRFLTETMPKVAGFLIPSTALYLAGIEHAQRGTVAGGICEIGVYKGKSFLAMSVDVPDGDVAMAIDIFDDQHLNMDATSAVNVLDDFRKNLDRFGLVDRVEIVTESSLELEAKGFLEAGPRFRLFSVDGGHLAVHVLNDLRVAEATLVPGGIVAADDVLHAHFLGVLTGIFEYLNSDGTLVPFALIPNKLLLTDAAHVESNKALLRDLFGAGLAKPDVPFHRATIDVYKEMAWTVRSTEGGSAPLLRPASTLEAAQAELAKAKAEVQRLTKRDRERERTLQKHEATLRRHREASARRAALVPRPLRPAAKKVYQRLTRSGS